MLRLSSSVSPLSSSSSSLSSSSSISVSMDVSFQTVAGETRTKGCPAKTTDFLCFQARKQGVYPGSASQGKKNKWNMENKLSEKLTSAIKYGSTWKAY